MNAITIFKVITFALIITANGITAATTTTKTSSLHTETNIAPISPLYLNCYDDGKNSTGPSEDSGLRFRIPVFDTIIHHHRGQGLHILKEPRKQWLFLLNGPELYRINLVGERTIFVLVGLLDDGMWKREHIGSEIISWHDYYILVVAFEKNIIVYQMEDDIITSAEVASPIHESTQNMPTFPTIQQLAIPKEYKKIFLFTPIVKKLILVLAMTDDETKQGRLKTFEWTQTYFTAIEEIPVPGVDVLSQQENYFIAGRTDKDGNTTMNVYKIERHVMKLTFIQTLNVNSRTPHFFFYRERHSIIACTDDESSCKIFRMYDDRYNFHRDSTSRRLVFSKFIVGHKYEVAERGNRITVVPNARVNCNSSFTSAYRGVSDIALHINQNGEMFAVLIYVGNAKTILRAVEVEDISGDSLGKGNQDDPEQIDPQTRKKRLFEYTVGQLRSVLLKRNTAMVLFRQIPKGMRVSVQNPVTIREGKIDVVNIVGSDLRSPAQLVNRVSQLARRYRSKWRQRRSLNNNNRNLTESEKTLLKTKRLRVDNLIYPRNIPEDFHLDSSAKPRPILFIRQPLSTKSLITSELLTPQKFRATRQSSLSLFDFAGDSLVTTGHLNVHTINNVPWSEFYESVFLKNRDDAIEGRLVMQAESRVDELKVSSVNGLAVNSLFNLVQPQIIISNVLFAGLKLLNLQADLINGLDFANDIAFSGTNVTINSKLSSIGSFHATYSGPCLHVLSRLPTWLGVAYSSIKQLKSNWKNRNGT